ncbi:winged helix-turn-helix domain-containing protein [Verrucomicrobiota bacterium]
MKPKNRKLRPRFKLWLSSDEAKGAFGDGKWRLLKAVNDEGSISAAAKKLGISYRKAWGDIKKAEQSLDVSLVEKHHGGKKGGSALLTKEGLSWVKAYSRFRSLVEKAVKKNYEKEMVCLKRR